MREFRHTGVIPAPREGSPRFRPPRHVYSLMSSLKQWVESHPVAAFYLLALALTWSIQSPGLFLGRNWTAAIVVYLGTFGAPLAAAVVVWYTGGDVRAWARQITHWRVGATWWLVSLLLPVVATLGVVAIYVAAGGRLDLDTFSWAETGAFYIGLMLFSLVLSGGLNEEPAWRGFAQPVLQERYGALRASLLVGVGWALWHLPLFFIPVAPHSQFLLVNQLLWIPGILVLSVLLAWLYNNTGSVLLVMVLHAGYNVVEGLIPFDVTQLLVDGVLNERLVVVIGSAQIGVYLLVAVVVVLVYGPRRLSDHELPDAGVTARRAGESAFAND